MTEKDFFYVDAVFELGNWGISTSISKNVYERFLFSRRSFHKTQSAFWP